jgi:hypothetical protein
MILASDRATYITILRIHQKPKLSVQHIGQIRHTHFIGRSSTGRWKIDFTGRNASYYTDVLDGSEKSQIIRLLAKLNNEKIDNLSVDLESLWSHIICGGEPFYQREVCSKCGHDL